MADFMIWIFIMFMALIVHESGHYIAYRAFGKKPSLRIVGITILMGENVIRELKNWEAAVVAFAGIVAGILPIQLMLFMMPYPVPFFMGLFYGIGLFYDIMIILKALPNLQGKFEG